MSQSVPRTSSVRHRLRAAIVTIVALAVTGGGFASAPAQAAVGDTQIAWLEVEGGAIGGGAMGLPALNSGDHGNFSGSGSYTFREAGMRSTMSVTITAAQAGTYPVWIRYAAGPLTPEEYDRSMGLVTNGSRQQVSYPLTGSWEDWEFVRAPQDVVLVAGVNTIEVNCDRGVDQETCRLNFDAVQIGGLAPDVCVATPVTPGGTALFDGTFATFDQWRKTGGGGFGHQTDCTIRSFRGPGATWNTTSQTGPYTLDVDWRRGDADDDSSVFVASTSTGAATPTGGYAVRIGASDTATIVPTGGTAQAADPVALQQAINPVGEWNRFTIQLTPSRIRVLLNGTAVNALDRTAPMTGYVGLENRSDADRVDFRDIEVRAGVDLGPLAGPVRRAARVDGTPHPGGESTLGHLVAESQRWATRGSAAGTARIALVSPTALTADLVASGTYPAPTTYAQAVAAVAADPLVNMRLTGAQLKTVLEQQWQRTAAGAVPATPFLRLGASDGFTWTEDATRPEGDRITGMWLDGSPILATDLRSVTVSQSLATGGDNFRGLVDGIGERYPDIDAESALAAYLADRAPTAPAAAQHAVGVHVPAEAPTSYVAGTTFAVDLSSWSYSTPSDLRDAGVEVRIGARTIGTFAVDHTLLDDPYDAHGTIAVRAVLPADLAAGPSVVTIVGMATGTTVRLPITVTAAPVPPTPTPTPPTPTPTPAPAPTPTPLPAPTSPGVSKAQPSMKVTVKQRRVVAGETKAKLVVTVSAAGVTPTGRVTVKVGTKEIRATLRGGTASVRLPLFAKRGTARIAVTYSGDARTLSAARTVKLRVLAT